MIFSVVATELPPNFLTIIAIMLPLNKTEVFIDMYVCSVDTGRTITENIIHKKIADVNQLF